jgi:hypothetical protein
LVGTGNSAAMSATLRTELQRRYVVVRSERREAVTLFARA